MHFVKITASIVKPAEFTTSHPRFILRTRERSTHPRLAIRTSGSQLEYQGERVFA